MKNQSAYTFLLTCCNSILPKSRLPATLILAGFFMFVDPGTIRAGGCGDGQVTDIFGSCCDTLDLDACGICFGTGPDDCGICPGEFGYGLGYNDCGLCPTDPDYEQCSLDHYGAPCLSYNLDDCNVCFGSGMNSCGLCEYDPGYSDCTTDVNGYICLTTQEDACGFCPTNPSYGIGCDPCSTYQITTNTTETASTNCSPCTGTASVSATGGVPPYSYNWSTGETTPAIGYGENAGTTNICINAGGIHYLAATGDTFVNDALYFIGNTNIFVNFATPDIANTIDDTLFRTERNCVSGSMQYRIPVTNGEYDVSLYFAELYFGVSPAPPGNLTPPFTGKRTFDVFIEGSQVLNDFDINDSVGPATAIIMTYQTTVSDDTLNLTFTNVVNRAKVNGICVKPHQSSSAGLCAGTYSVTVTDSNGCSAIDSVVIAEPGTDTIVVNASICDGDSIYVGGAYQKTAGTYEDSYTGSNGCDSLVVTSLTTQSCVDTIDCVVGEWSEWGPCSVTCGDGIQIRTRNILTSPQNGGASCPVLTDTVACNLGPCPVDCIMSAWGPWSGCDTSCGGGLQFRTRTVLVPAQFGGAACGDTIEYQACNVQPCPVDCIMSAWGPWSGCDTSCGGGLQFRTRTILVLAQFGGVSCGDTIEYQACNVQPCPVDCIMSAWGPWSSCDAACGGGQQFRTRTVLVPAQFGGATCGDTIEYQACNEQPCSDPCSSNPVIAGAVGTSPTGCTICNGTATVNISGGTAPYNFSWSTGETTQSVGSGDYAGTSHKCINAGGTQYIASTGDTFVSGSLLFSGSTAQYSTTAAIAGSPDTALFRTERNCISGSMTYKVPVSNGQYEVSLYFAELFYGVSNFPATDSFPYAGLRKFDVFIEGTQVLDDYDINADVGPATATIKTYITTVSDDTLNITFTNVLQRAKINAFCIKPHHGSNGLCAGTYYVTVSDSNGCSTVDSVTLSAPNPDTTNINSTLCNGDSLYVGGGYQKTAGTYEDHHTASDGCDSIVLTTITIDPCADTVDCEVSAWSDWGPCSVTCGDGIQIRTRTITVSPQNGGAACPVLADTSACNLGPCPVDCVMSEWSEWSNCDTSCGGGLQYRTRTVLIPAQFGGTACGDTIEYQACNTQPCPVDCIMSEWSEWSECDTTCGGGQQYRTRTVLVPAQFGGAACGDTIEYQACNSQPCDLCATVTCDDSDTCTTDYCIGGVCFHDNTCQTCTLKVISFTLVNSATDLDIVTIDSGSIINLFATPNINIRANLCVDPVGSVRFVLNGSVARTENQSPYALAGDSPTGNYNNWNVSPGTYTLQATPYSGASATGTVGTAKTITFTVINQQIQCVDSASCNDNNPCTVDICSAGQCVNLPIVCNDSNLCTIDACIDGVCVFAPNTCDDNDPCTIDSCINGICSNLQKICDDNNPCTEDVCVNGACVFVPNTCDDNNPCTADTCINGICSNTPKNCNDQNSCTTDYCSLGVCYHTDTCQPCPLEIVSLTLVNSATDLDIRSLDSGAVINLFVTPHINIRANPCAQPVGSVVFILNGHPSRTENTAPYALAGDSPVGNYSDWNVAPGIYTLTAKPYSGTGGSGTAGISKTVTFQIINNQLTCQGSSDCNDNNPCTTDTCINGQCSNILKVCDDGNACTIDNCVAGVCVFSPNTCDDNNACTVDLCLAGQCINTPVVCNDSNLCTMDECLGGVCVYTALVCDDDNPCTIDSCDAASGCLHVPIANCCTSNFDCDDNNPCTIDQCTGFTCIHTDGGSSEPTYLKVINTSKSWRKLKLGYGPTSVWAPLQNVVAGGNTQLCITLRDPSGTAEWNKIQIRAAAGYAVTLSNYISGTIPNWTTICIPLSDFGGFNFASISLLELPYCVGAGPFEIHIQKVEFTGGTTPFLWFGDPHINNANDGNTAGALVTELVVGGPCGRAAKWSGNTTRIDQATFDSYEPFLNAYPNPFSEKVTIEFALSETSKVRLEIIGIDGRKIGTLYEGDVQGNELNTASFEAGTLASGMYFYRLISESGEVFTRKLTLFR